MNPHQIDQRIKMLKLAKLQRIKFESRMARYRQNPVQWLVERFREDPKAILWSEYPEYEKHSWDGDRDPLALAWNLLAKGYRKVGIESATSTGKTYILARIVYWFLDTFENPLVVTCAPKEDQLKLHLWKEMSVCYNHFQAIRPHSVMNSLYLRKDVTDRKYAESAIAKGFVAGVGASEESATKAQGFHQKNMLIIVEETPGVHEAIIKAFKNTSTGTNNFMLCVGNPDNQLDSLHQFATAPGAKLVRISGYDHPNYVLKQEVIPGAVTRVSVDERKLEYGEGSQFFKSRVRGISPKEATDSLFKLRDVEHVMNYLDGDEHLEFETDPGTYNALGIDVANSEEGDKGAAVFGKSNLIRFVSEFQCPNANHIAYNVLLDNEEIEARGYHNYNLPKIKDYGIHDQCIGIDGVGVGAGTVNAFKDEGIECISLMGGQLVDVIVKDRHGNPMYRFNSLRSQMFWELAKDIRDHAFFFKLGNIPEIQKMKAQIKKELMAHTYSTKGGTLAILPKEEVKKRLGNKSPNYADALAYWNWIRKGYYLGAWDYSPVAV